MHKLQNNSVDEIVYFCKKCGDILEIKFDQRIAEGSKASDWKTKPLGVWRYRPLYAHPRSHQTGNT
jgi:threonine synthase